MRAHRLIVGITGASGAVYGVRLLQLVRTEMGGIVCPLAPSFYIRPQRIDELVDHIVGRVLDLVGLGSLRPVKRWGGLGDAQAVTATSIAFR